MRALLLFILPVFFVVASSYEFNNYQLEANHYSLLNVTNTGHMDYRMHLTISNGDAKIFVYDTNNYILYTKNIEAFYYSQVSVPDARNVINVDTRVNLGNQITHIVIKSTNVLEPVYINGYITVEPVYLPKAEQIPWYAIIIAAVLFLGVVVCVLFNCLVRMFELFRNKFCTKPYSVVTETDTTEQELQQV